MLTFRDSAAIRGAVQILTVCTSSIAFSRKPCSPWWLLQAIFVFGGADMDRHNYEKTIDLVSTLVEPLGYECVEIEWDGAEETLRVFIDHPDGIKMEDCLKVNEVLIESLELDSLVKRDYRLEVSSPGIERPLRRRDHFIKHLGQSVHVRLLSKVENRMEGSGKLLGIDQDDIVSLELPAGVWAFPLQTIRKAHVVFEW